MYRIELENFGVRVGCLITGLMEENVAYLAAQLLEDGKVVLHPTDTVYGLAADPCNSHALSRLSLCKKRGIRKPFLVLVNDSIMLEEFAILTPVARDLVVEFEGRPLTLLLQPRGSILKRVQNGLPLVGFRITSNVFCKEVIESIGRPIASTSANVTGMPHSYTASDVVRQIGIDYISLIVDAGELPLIVPSTILNASGEKAVLERVGAIPIEEFGPYF